MPVTYDSSGNVSGALYARGWGLDYQQPDASGPLSEDAAIPDAWRAPAGSACSMRDTPPPHRGPCSSLTAMMRVHLISTDRQASPHGAVSVELNDDHSALKAHWSGNGAGTLRLSGRAADLPCGGTLAGEALELRYRVDEAPTQSVKVGASHAPQPSTSPEPLKPRPPDSGQQLSIPLSCLAGSVGDLTEVAIPFAVETTTVASICAVDFGGTAAAAKGGNPVLECAHGAQLVKLGA